MTFKEVIDCIDDVLNSEYHYDESLGYQLTSDDFEWLEKAKNALEKQIPKKPNIHGYREGREVNTISYTCPICNKHIGRDAFCKHCGQALDWGDRE